MFNKICYLFTQVRHLHERKLPSIGSITSTTKSKYIVYKSPEAMDYNINKKPKPFPKKKLKLVNIRK